MERVLGARSVIYRASTPNRYQTRYNVSMYIREGTLGLDIGRMFYTLMIALLRALIVLPSASVDGGRLYILDAYPNKTVMNYVANPACSSWDDVWIQYQAEIVSRLEAFTYSNPWCSSFGVLGGKA